jgi:predicted secreted protein
MPDRLQSATGVHQSPHEPRWYRNGRGETLMKPALIATSLCLAALAAAKADQPAPAAQQPAYIPGLGDLMTMTVQPRHIKLGLAGQARNWAYAAYEFGELQEALDEVAEMQPVWNTVPIGVLLHADTKQPLESIAAAIKAADAERFRQAYASLTAACNQCHKSAGKAAIVIRVPTESPYPDQDFLAPAK